MAYPQCGYFQTSLVSIPYSFPVNSTFLVWTPRSRSPPIASPWSTFSLTHDRHLGWSASCNILFLCCVILDWPLNARPRGRRADLGTEMDWWRFCSWAEKVIVGSCKPW
jgi:hypothetical protein